MTTPNDQNAAIIKGFRENAGKVGGRYENIPLVLLTTKGAKSGKARVNPLACLPEGDRLYVFASRGGGPNNPDWYHNVVANPDVTVEYGTERFPAKALVLQGKERDEVYARQAALRPRFAEYQRMTKRTIPVVALVRKT
ncbi:MAG: nitroreductase family deazaflavin-dependent oxidoreductase [SAR202 cluster bacterium]|nr:nitroreductase family deazaflavin-dependent oxidoreductase [SAR202 cluster bacterium]